MNSVIKLEHLNKSFGSQQVLKNFNIEFAYLLHRDVDGILLLGQSRKGEGDLFTPADKNISEQKKFLSGIVETRRQIGIEINVQVFRDCFFKTRYTYQQITNEKHHRDQNRNSHQFYFNFHVNY